MTLKPTNTKVTDPMTGQFMPSGGVKRVALLPADHKLIQRGEVELLTDAKPKKTKESE